MAPSERSGRDEAERLLPPSRGSEVVLLVEDDDMVRALSKAILENEGYTVIEASHGGEALVIVEERTGSIDLILTDVVMPNMNGRELVERARRLRPSLRALYASGYADDAIVKHGVLEPGTPFIQKPFNVRALSTKVRQVLDAPRGEIGQAAER